MVPTSSISHCTLICLIPSLLLICSPKPFSAHIYSSLSFYSSSHCTSLCPMPWPLLICFPKPAHIYSSLDFYSCSHHIHSCSHCTSLWVISCSLPICSSKPFPAHVYSSLNFYYRSHCTSLHFFPSPFLIFSPNTLCLVTNQSTFQPCPLLLHWMNFPSPPFPSLKPLLPLFLLCIVPESLTPPQQPGSPPRCYP